MKVHLLVFTQADLHILGDACVKRRSQRDAPPLKRMSECRVMHGDHAGKLKAQELIDFLSQHAGDAPAADASGSSSKKAGKTGAAGEQEADDEGLDDKDKVVPQVGL